MPISHTYLGGQPASASEHAPLAFGGYAHFTAMQERDRACENVTFTLDVLHTVLDDHSGGLVVAYAEVRDDETADAGGRNRG
ncbi:hypothetical protein [Phytoactinopolyspora halophila]|uniref:hypothetical protein n=1 Tax=Phytoactinopolyspora halophila TaxID=1981511 RepID=UPI001B8AD113|nr:hypothetical protein [Phytoactinopolyspora halophila]